MPDLIWPANWLAPATAGLVVGLMLGLLLAAGRMARLSRRRIELQAELDAERRVHAEREQAFDEARDQLADAFSHLSGEALRRNNAEFLRLAEEHLKRHQAGAQSDLAQRQQSIEALVRPMKEALDRAQEQIQRLERQRSEAYGSLQRHLEVVAEAQRELRGETRNLVQALRRPEVRGRWGEMTLRRLVELAGMTEHCDFDEQATTEGSDGPLRPDMVVRLPDERCIVVDVKTPLDAYLDATEAADDNARDDALKRHARNIRARVRELSAKRYWAQFRQSPDFAVLFIPGEQFLAAAVERDPELIEDALLAKVIPASPTSFIAVLRTVAFSWRQLEITRNAEELRDLGETLYRRLSTFTEHLGRLGRSLSAGVEQYNRAVGSLERSVMPSARRLAELGLSRDAEATAPSRVEQSPRDSRKAGES